MAYDDHVVEHFAREKEEEARVDRVVRRAIFRDNLDLILRRYDDALNHGNKNLLEGLEEKVKALT